MMEKLFKKLTPAQTKWARGLSVCSACKAEFNQKKEHDWALLGEVVLENITPTNTPSICVIPLCPKCASIFYEKIREAQKAIHRSTFGTDFEVWEVTRYGAGDPKSLVQKAKAVTA